MIPAEDSSTREVQDVFGIGPDSTMQLTSTLTLTQLAELVESAASINQIEYSLPVFEFESGGETLSYVVDPQHDGCLLCVECYDEEIYGTSVPAWYMSDGVTIRREAGYSLTPTAVQKAIDWFAFVSQPHFGSFEDCLRLKIIHHVARRSLAGVPFRGTPGTDRTNQRRRP